MYKNEITSPPMSIAKALPIEIKREHYNLISARFDPIQNSPPSLWKMRLNKRIGENPLRKTMPITEFCAKLEE